MEKNKKLAPGSYAIIRWSAMEPEQVCMILGYRRGEMIVRNENGEDVALNPKSTQIVGLKEVNV